MCKSSRVNMSKNDLTLIIVDLILQNPVNNLYKANKDCDDAQVDHRLRLCHTNYVISSRKYTFVDCQ